MVHLTKLRAQSVRGLPRSWPDLSIVERGIVICGDNGVGKSSIVDALEYSLTGRSTLYPTNRLGVSWDKGSPHVRNGTSSLWIEIETKQHRVRIAPETPLETIPDEARTWAARARQSTFVLRRHMLVDFVNCEPSKRYSALEPFLNLSAYDAVERSLTRWQDELNTSCASLVVDKKRLDSSLRSMFGMASGVEISEERLLQSLNGQLFALKLKQCHDLTDIPGLRASIEAQLGGEGISHRMAQLRALKNALAGAGLPNNLLPLIQSLKEAGHSLQRAEAVCTAWEQALDNIPVGYLDTVALLKDLIAAAEGDDVQTTALIAMEHRIAASLVSHSAALENVESEILAEGGGERRPGLLNARDMLNGLISTLPAHRALQKRLEWLRRQADVVGSLQGHAVDARKEAVQDLFDEVANLANRFYEILHPEENIGESALRMRRATARSTDLSTVFDGSIEHPFLHYSESHLDTLGLCYFLAFRRQEAENHPEFKLVVLDDVLHSVDAAHRARFVRLLGAEFADHQLVVTTHDTILFGQLRQRLGGACTFSRIIGWDIEVGPRFARFSTDLEKLIFGDPKDVQPEDVAGSAGRLFEEVLRNLAERLEITGPLKFEKPYTIGDIWPPLCKACKKQKGFGLAKPGAVECLDETYWVRNACGAHVNEPASPVTHKEIFEFRDALIDFIHATSCSGCNEMISKRGNGDWKCECGLLHYERTVDSPHGKAAQANSDLFSLRGRGVEN